MGITSSMVNTKTKIDYSDNELKMNRYKAAVGKFPTGVTVISTSFEGELYGFTANSFTSISLEPCIVSFCLSQKSGCVKGFISGEHFSISILASDQENISNNFASHRADKFLNAEYFLLSQSECPVIAGCLSYLECKRKEVINCGDHYIFIGEVIDFEICDDRKSPLVYFAKSYRKI